MYLLTDLVMEYTEGLFALASFNVSSTFDTMNLGLLPPTGVVGMICILGGGVGARLGTRLEPGLDAAEWWPSSSSSGNTTFCS